MKINEEKLEKLKLDYVYSFYLDEHQKNLVKAAYEAGYRAFPDGPEMRVYEERVQRLVETLKFYRVRSNIPLGEIINALEQQVSLYDVLSAYIKRADDALKGWEENE